MHNENSTHRDFSHANTHTHTGTVTLCQMNNLYNPVNRQWVLRRRKKKLGGGWGWGEAVYLAGVKVQMQSMDRLPCFWHSEGDLVIDGLQPAGVHSLPWLQRLWTSRTSPSNHSLTSIGKHQGRELTVLNWCQTCDKGRNVNDLNQWPEI